MAGEAAVAGSLGAWASAGETPGPQARTGGPPPQAAVELRRIDKRFGAVRANRDVDLAVERGSITGIVGENGAGKSTLVSILYGFYTADSGEILIDGEPVRLGGAADAIAHGIGMVHQHFMLAPAMTVLENVMLGNEGGPWLARGERAARARMAELGAAYGLEIDPDAPAGGLPVGLQQRVEILKALWRGARILILDEPTGVLTPQEAGRLFDVLGILKRDGVTILLITHKLREIMAVTDAVYVMRRGEMVARRETRSTSQEELARLMVGRDVPFAAVGDPAVGGPAVGGRGVGRQEVGGQEVGGQEVGGPGVGGPGVGGPGVGGPGVGGPGVGGPGVGGPGVGGPGVGGPGVGRPGVGRQGVGRQGIGGPDAKGPDGGRSRGGGPADGGRDVRVRRDAPFPGGMDPRFRGNDGAEVVGRTKVGGRLAPWQSGRGDGGPAGMGSGGKPGGSGPGGSGPEPPLLRVEALGHTDDRGVSRLIDVGFDLRAGEILGVAGVAGNGQSELLDVLSGIAPLHSGRITFAGRTITAADPADPSTLRDLGLAHVPEDRQGRGLVLPFTAFESSILGYQDGRDAGGGVLLALAAVRRRCADLMERYDVRPPDPDLRCGGFSGGNQQKLVVARELSAAPRVLLAGQPTRGVDIGAIEFIHARLLEIRDAGCAILLVSVELDEILALSDRILVMNAGRIVGEAVRGEADAHRIGLMMAGVGGAGDRTGPADRAAGRTGQTGRTRGRTTAE